MNYTQRRNELRVDLRVNRGLICAQRLSFKWHDAKSASVLVSSRGGACAERLGVALPTFGALGQWRNGCGVSG
jgi:hypothetical protein